jgi:hypothetical protein
MGRAVAASSTTSVFAATAGRLWPASALPDASPASRSSDISVSSAAHIVTSARTSSLINDAPYSALPGQVSRGSTRGPCLETEDCASQRSRGASTVRPRSSLAAIKASSTRISPAALLHAGMATSSRDERCGAERVPHNGSTDEATPVEPWTMRLPERGRTSRAILGCRFPARVVTCRRVQGQMRVMILT